MASAGFAVMAAILWFCSAMVKTPKEFSIQVTTLNEEHHLVIGPFLSTHAESPELNTLGKSVIKQSRLSARAALCAAAAAIFQVALVVYDHHWIQWLK